MTIWEIIESALGDLNPAVPFAAMVYPIDTGSGGVYPDLFIVYNLIDDPPVQFADNLEAAKLSRIQISVFNRAGLVGLPDIVGVMAAAGFVRSDSRPLPFDKSTYHYGIAYDFTYLESS